MLHGAHVGHHYQVALDGYANEADRHPDDVLVFREMLRGSSRTELGEWYELYKDNLKAGQTRKLKKADIPK